MSKTHSSNQLKKLMLIGSTSNPVHLKNYYHLIKDYFDEVLIVGTHPVDFANYFIVDFSIKNPLKVIKNIRRLRQKMNEFQPTIVHVHQANSFGYIAGKANNHTFPLVLTTWGDDVLINPKKNKFYKYLATTSLKNADAVTADASIMKDAIHSFYKNIPVTIANFGIQLTENNPSDKQNIIYSNRLHDDLYNIDQIINGCAGFLKENSTWKLILAAVGKNTEKLKNQVKELQLEQQVEFVGFLAPAENVANYLQAKIYISIPNTDGTSMSLLEAMAYECIPIVSDLPANKEWIVDGENGIVVKNNDVSSSLQQALKLDAEKVKKMNHSIIQERATKSANQAKFITIYHQLID